MANYFNEAQSKALWQKIILESGKLPSLPGVITSLIRELKSEDYTPESIEKIIINDASLSAKLLAVANSAYYGQEQQIETISRAVVLLGTNTIRNLAIAVASYSTLNKKLEGYGLEKGQLFIHSLATAAGAGYIAKHTKSKDHESVFVAGLLHDIGKILLGQSIQKYFVVIKDIVEKQDKPFNIAEREVFGFNHCDIGAELAKKWELPEIIINANKYHHDPSESPAEHLSVVEYIHLSDHIAYLCKFGLGVDENNYFVIDKIFEKYNMNETRKAHFMETVKEETSELFKSIF